MKIKWNKYTWYSRLAALIFFVGVMPALTFYIGEQYGETINELESSAAIFIPIRFPVASSVISTPTPDVKVANVIITSEDSNKTITLHKGDQFLVQLGDLDWTLSLSKEGIVNRIKNIATVRGAQGIYTADEPGTTVLSGTGRPHCEKGEICAMFIVSFKTTIKVVQ